MEFDFKTKRPLVRIGVLQFEKKMTFSSQVPFRVEDISGNVLASGEKNRKYEAMVLNTTPPASQIKIRLAICYEHEEAQKIAEDWQGKNLEIHIERVGQKIQIATNKFIDNREYWVLTGEFESYETADQVRRNLPDFGSYQIIQVAENKISGTISFEGKTIKDGIRIVPLGNSKLHFTLDNVRVGIGFHWDHRESQDLEGILEFHIDKKGLLTAVNVLDIEKYLASVNSSEMTPDCNLEFLKAQTVVARCTVFATSGKHHFEDPFDLCADDHCQCFHGAGVIYEKSLQASVQTRGEILQHEGRVCDTRYAKICAGIGESYKNVWDNRHIKYLDKFVDSQNGKNLNEILDNEKNIRTFIQSSHDVFCNPDYYQIPNYLEYAHDYYRWEAEYSPEEFGRIVAMKLGKDLGPIEDVIPLQRGDSGRIIYAKVIGELGEAVIGKELEIRNVLSKTHLYSSCFYVEKEMDSNGNLNQIRLKGAGWGHGVGICQVGAAVMGEEGYKYSEILNHYYQNTKLSALYN